MYLPPMNFYNNFYHNGAHGDPCFDKCEACYRKCDNADGGDKCACAGDENGPSDACADWAKKNDCMKCFECHAAPMPIYNNGAHGDPCFDKCEACYKKCDNADGGDKCACA